MSDGLRDSAPCKSPLEADVAPGGGLRAWWGGAVEKEGVGFPHCEPRTQGCTGAPVSLPLVWDHPVCSHSACALCARLYDSQAEGWFVQKFHSKGLFGRSPMQLLMLWCVEPFGKGCLGG